MSATLVCLARPQYTVVVDFAIAVNVELTTSDDFSVGICDRYSTTTNVLYGSTDIGTSVYGSTDDQTVRPASKANGGFGTLPRVE